MYRYLATGDNLNTLHFLFRVGVSTVNAIITETTESICRALCDREFPEITMERLKQIAQNFQNRTKFPNVIGAIDGKHVTLKAPPNSGTLYHDFKKQFSIVLLGICDSNYRFTYVNVGDYGSISDGGIFRNCELGKMLDNGEFPLPPNDSTTGLPYCFLGDSGFPLRKYLMVPYNLKKDYNQSKVIYNQQLSKGRTIIENSFGILTARWRVFANKITLSPEKSQMITMACICLHNFILSSRDSNLYNPPDFTDTLDETGSIQSPGNWRDVPNVLNPIDVSGFGGRPRQEAERYRTAIKDFLNQNSVN